MVILTLLIHLLLAHNYLLNDLVDVVWVAVLHGDAESFVVLLDLEEEGNLFDDVAFVVDEER